jgi:hypothetical protein
MAKEPASSTPSPRLYWMRRAIAATHAAAVARAVAGT